MSQAVVEAMDTSGRAILLAGTTVIIALLGMFATGVTFLYGLSIASVLAVLLVLCASLTVLPAMLSRFGETAHAPEPLRAPPRGEGPGAARVIGGAAGAAPSRRTRGRWPRGRSP